MTSKAASATYVVPGRRLTPRPQQRVAEHAIDTESPCTNIPKLPIFKYAIVDVEGDTQPQVIEAAKLTSVATNQCRVNGELIGAAKQR